MDARREPTARTIIRYGKCLAWAAAALLGAAAEGASHELSERAALLDAWERAQIADPKTLRFERAGPGRYRFATGYFPFDGELIVLDVRLAPEDAATSLRHGTVEVALADVTEEFYERHVTAVAAWHETHYFVFDGDSWRPLSAVGDRAARPRWLPLTWAALALVASLLAFLWIHARASAVGDQTR